MYNSFPYFFSLKVIHLISSLRRGGRERQLATIVANTDKKKYPAKIVYFNQHNNSYIEEYDLADFSLQVKAQGKFARLKGLRQIIKDEKPDIVYTWGNGESVVILLFKLFHRFKFINGSVRHGIRASKFSHYFRTLVLHLSQYVVANSKAGLKANNLRSGKVLYNGVDKKFLEPLANRAQIRKELSGTPDSIPLLISLANLVPYKDYFSILKALKQLKEEKYSFRYLILGEGPMRSQIEDKINEYNLQENIRITGNVENVSEYLKISDIFIHSSKGEGCSNAILEAMAAGLPIIASDTGGTREIITEKNGFLFKYQYVNEFKKHLSYCLDNKDICKELGENSIADVNNWYTVQKMMNNYYKIINEIV